MTPVVQSRLYGNFETPLFFQEWKMNEGKTSKQILRKLTFFSVPLILSGLLQQLFNWVDALIVGNIAGETALAGIGATTSLYNLFVTVIVGFTSGLSVLFAQRFGEGKHEENTKLLASYTVILAVFFTAVCVAGIIFTGQILELMDTPKQLYGPARDYLTVIFAGIPFLAVYNTYSAALRGMGNSKVPFVAVLISSVTNAVLDYVFVYFCGFEVQGAAAATVISQVAMTVYIAAYTAVKYPQMRFSPFRLKGCRDVAKTGSKYGMPPAVQSSVSSAGNILLQRFMNGFGEQTVAAVTTAYRVDTVLLLPIINFSTAISTMVAQETGAGNREDAKRILRTGTLLMIVMSLVLTAVIVAAGRPLLAMFGLTAGAVDTGESFFRTIAVFYVIYGAGMSIKGYLEGTADLLFSGATGVCALVVRIICSYMLVGIWGNMVIAYAEAFSWVFLAVVYALRYRNRSRKEKVSVSGT